MFAKACDIDFALGHNISQTDSITGDIREPDLPMLAFCYFNEIDGKLPALIFTAEYRFVYFISKSRLGPQCLGKQK
jgi:hypothetical protein